MQVKIIKHCTLVGVKNIDVLGELGALVSPALPQSS